MIFPASGPVRLELEHLPREKKQLELTIGKKFLGAMSHLGLGTLTVEARTEEPADLLCIDSDGRRVGIQVTEMVDVFGAKLNAHRDNYLRALKESCADTLEKFSGCALEFLDDGTNDFFPPLNRSKGEAMLADLASHLETLGREIDTLGVNKIRHRKLEIGASGTAVSLICQRREEPTPESAYSIRWGRQRVFNREEINGLLSETIRNKIKMRYGPPKYEFWLLVYTTDMPITRDEASIGLAAALLECNPHPFNKIWFFFPYHDRERGHVVQVWPRN